MRIKIDQRGVLTDHELTTRLRNAPRDEKGRIPVYVHDKPDALVEHPTGGGFVLESSNVATGVFVQPDVVYTGPPPPHEVTEILRTGFFARHGEQDQS